VINEKDNMPDREQKVKQLVTAMDRACRSQGFLDYMPAAMVGHFVKQVVPASLKNDLLDMDQFYKWVRSEYSVPDHVFSRVFSILKDEAEKLGVGLVLPLDYEPGFNETLKEWLRSELKDTVYQELKHEMRKKVEEDLSRELRPEIHQKLRESMEKAGIAADEFDARILASMQDEPAGLGGQAPAAPAPSAGLDPDKERQKLADELRPRVEAELRAELSESLRRELRAQVEQEVMESVTGRVTGEVYRIIRDPSSAKGADPALRELVHTLRSELSGSVRQELRKELWDEVREEVKNDMSKLLVPGEGAPADDWGGEVQPPRGLSLSAEDHLAVIRRIREELSRRIKNELAAELEDLAESSRELERKNRMRSCMNDPRQCLEKIKNFLFPDQPGTWELVARFVDPAAWAPLALAADREFGEYEAEKIERARKIIRDALVLKAEIEKELELFHQHGGKRLASTAGVLSEAEAVLDVALESIAGLLKQSAPLV